MVMQQLASQVVILLELRRKSLALLEEFCKLQDNKSMICSCSYCRKIRDGNGSWLPFEDYMMRHSTLELQPWSLPGLYDRAFS